MGGQGQGFGDFDPSNFDPNMLGQMFSQLGSMFSGMGAGMSGGGGGPVNYQVAMNLARQQIGSFTPILDKEISASADAVRLADVWLDDATTFPAASPRPSRGPRCSGSRSPWTPGRVCATRSPNNSHAPGRTTCPPRRPSSPARCWAC